MRKNKYNNKKFYWNGFTFDSKKEYNYYVELKHKSEKLNEFKLIVKPIFELIPKFKFNNASIRRATIQPDFLLIYPPDNDCMIYEVQDVKGFDKKKNKFRTTEKFDLQWKLLKFMALAEELRGYEYNKESVSIPERAVEWKFTLV